MLTGHSKMQCGLLGEHLSHSFSPQIHALLSDYTYRLIELPDEASVGAFLEKGDFDALNVTIPYKQTVIPYMAELSETALKIGAVNTITKRPDGQLVGDNTDYYGFESMVRKSGIRMEGRKVLILGSGGASKTARVVCKDLGASDVVIISRKGPDDYDHIDRHQDAGIIVNCTPVGMFPGNGSSPVDLSAFPELLGVFDMIYNPSRTALLLQAEKLGIPHANGLSMLVYQAVAACERFLHATIDPALAETIHSRIAFEMSNIVLVGMPGSGKTTIGQKLSEVTGRKLVDTDEWIVQKVGKAIPDIFKEAGEEHFRMLEHEAAEEAGKQSGIIISTGGGIVTRQENYDALHQNGTIFWIERPLDDLPVEGRPLSNIQTLGSMYQKRAPMYRAFSDRIIWNTASVGKAVEAILEE